MRIGAGVVLERSLRGRIQRTKGAELRHCFGNQNRDLSLKMWVEEQQRIEPQRPGLLPVWPASGQKQASPLKPKGGLKFGLVTSSQGHQHDRLQGRTKAAALGRRQPPRYGNHKIDNGAVDCLILLGFVT